MAKNSPEVNKRYNRSEKGKRRVREYKAGEKSLAAQRRHDATRNKSRAAEQKERRSRPEYVLAQKLGVRVAVARAMIEKGVTT
jgi:hypothetical protein